MEEIEGQSNITVEESPVPSCKRQVSKDIEEIQEGLLRAKEIGKSATAELLLLLTEGFGHSPKPAPTDNSSNNEHLSASRTNLSSIVRNSKCNNYEGSKWIANEDDDEETATLRRISYENRELLVQLDAAREALFNHQRKTQDNMEKIEEETEDLKRRLSEATNKENTALLNVRSLEMALQEMQSEKQLIQKTASESLDELLKAECQKRNDLEETVNKLNQELESKEEDNIRLRMTIIKVQEDLTRENHLKDAAIEHRDFQLTKLKSELAELRMKGEENEHSEIKNIQTKSSQDQTKENSDQNPSQIVLMLRQKLEEQQTEINQLREENERLRENIRSVDQTQSDSNFATNEIISDSLELQGPNENAPPKVNGTDSDSLLNSIGNLETEEVREQNTGADESEKDEAIYRLQLRLHEMEDSCRKAQNRADHMTYLLNQKLIELNKLQLTLSGQTKEMIQLEKAYFQLKCHLNKGYRSSTPSSRNSSRVDLSTT